MNSSEMGKKSWEARINKYGEKKVKELMVKASRSRKKKIREEEQSK